MSGTGLYAEIHSWCWELRVHFSNTYIKKSSQPRLVEAKMLENTQQANGVGIWEEIHKRKQNKTQGIVYFLL